MPHDDQRHRGRGRSGAAAPARRGHSERREQRERDLNRLPADEEIADRAGMGRNSSSMTAGTISDAWQR